MITVLITGNQAGDLDSTVCSICLSRLLSLTDRKTRYIPVLKRNRAKLHLNPEIQALLSYLETDFSSLDFEESETIQKLIKNHKTAFFLVDHNDPEPGIAPERILGIIDHHKDAGVLLKQHTELSRRIVEPCGSCAALISREWQRKKLTPPRETALLLGAAILVDTGYFDPEWGKTTDLDREQYAFLRPCFSDKDEDFLHTLIDVKNNLCALNISDHLIRDYKDISGAEIPSGISSIPLPLTGFYVPPLYNAKSVSDFMEEKKLDILYIMHTTQAPFSREISVIPSRRIYGNVDLRNHLKKEILALKELELTEQPCPLSRACTNAPGPWFCYSQGNVKASRKAALPLLKEISFKKSERKL
jgi:inorganic pyrophosphatase/exopolyphosphatase